MEFPDPVSLTLQNLKSRIFNLSFPRELLDTGDFEVMTLEADEDEHSIEMHLPYVAKVKRESNNQER